MSKDRYTAWRDLPHLRGPGGVGRVEEVLEDDTNTLPLGSYVVAEALKSAGFW